MVERLHLKGKPIELSMITVGAQLSKIESKVYTVFLIDQQGKYIEIEVIGLKQISSPIGGVDTTMISSLFGVSEPSLNRPRSGEIDLLIGLQYAAYHPDKVESQGHLVLYRNRFGSVIGGTHPRVKEETKLAETCSQVRVATTMHATTVYDRFFTIEGLGVSCSPKCGSCRCGRCHPGGKDMSLKEEREYDMIEKAISFDVKKGRWLAGYPWIKDPKELKDNRHVALAILRSTERRLKQNETHQSIYSEQIHDMLNRKAARLVTKRELQNYDGAKFYLAHHAVYKPESKSTPVRIVFNSSASFCGLSLNDCLATGPSLLNMILGVLLRFRAYPVAFIGDIKKMYHSIDIPTSDQMTHLFLWRDCDERVEPVTYAMTAVNMGDKPSATIAQIALRKTAEEAMSRYPEAAQIVLRNAYMDDIPGSVLSEDEAIKLMQEMERLLGDKGFKVKEWNHNVGDKIHDTERNLVSETIGKDSTEGVLGMRWNMARDVLKFKMKKFDGQMFTKRTVLSVVNSMYDPNGLLTPFTVKAKILMRKIWSHEPKLGWDDQLPQGITTEWKGFLDEISYINEISFKRSLMPDAKAANPILVIFSDGSEKAYGAVAYIRWCVDGKFISRLVMGKSRVAPLKTIDIVRLELCGAVLSKRVRDTVSKELSIKFTKVIHLTDSEIVHAMIHKQSYGFNTFTANRVGEIQQGSLPVEWAWVPGDPSMNVSDVVTRGCSLAELNAGSLWQDGPEFLTQPEENWPIRYEVNKNLQIPELKSASKTTEFVGLVQRDPETLGEYINSTRFSKWRLLVHTTARILCLYNCYRKSTPQITLEPASNDLEEAELFWVKEVQKCISIKQHKNLRPETVNGIILVGGRTERWMACTWNRQRFMLLPRGHHVSWLIARHIHENGGHLGLAASMSKVRSKYWIIGLRIMMKKIIRECRKCKEKLKQRLNQVMSPLPENRIKESPAFHSVGIDYFGPFIVRGEVQKRTRGKAYGVILTCHSSRAVYVDIAPDLSTDGFLQALRRFTSVRGWPSKIYSDRGTQFIGASKELKQIIEGLNWIDIKRHGWKNGTEWEFAPADAKWYNGATESLVKSVKRALTAAIGESVLKYSELQTCVFEAAELVNERPIGVHPSSPEEGTYLCPNDLLLGRASSKVPHGPFKERSTNRHRFDFVQTVITAFWRRWTREVFPNLVIQKKWHTQHRDLKKGDVVLVEDANLVRGQWKMAVVEEPIRSQENRVRRVVISYKTAEGTLKVVERPVQKLILLVAN